MPGHPSTTHAHPTTKAEDHAQNSPDAPEITVAEGHAQNSPDTHPTGIRAQSPPPPSHPANPPTHFTAGNSFGPYLYDTLTENHPHPQFLGSLRSDPALNKLDVPDYLFTNRSHMQTPASSSAPVDTFRYYLCASLARHHAYRNAYRTEGTTDLYRSSHDRFTEALQSSLHTGSPPTRRRTEPARRRRTNPHPPLLPHLAPPLHPLLPRQPPPPPPPPLALPRLPQSHPPPRLDRPRPRDPRCKPWLLLEQEKRALPETIDAWLVDVQQAMDARCSRLGTRRAWIICAISVLMWRRSR